MAYDPIVEAMNKAVGAVSPTFVDDLAALVWGPRHAALAQAFLCAAGHCAGLLTESHDCGRVDADLPFEEAARAVEALPVRLYWTEGGACRIKGMEPTLLADWLGRMGVRTRAWHEPCGCKMKTALVPAYDIRAWKCALQRSVMGQ
ncbi:MAG: hypothetical protein ACKPKO_48605, partial [Candidatus Fonsibacter sp.]